MGRPQNRDSRSLRIRSCLTYLVSAGVGSGGITWSSVMAMVAPCFESMVMVFGVLHGLPGARAHC